MSSRRLFCASLLSALAASPVRAAADENQPLHSFTRLFADMPAHASAATTTRPIVQGTTATGDPVEVHETTLNPGAEPHPPHRHKHEEFILLITGTLQATVDGQTSTLTPGSVGFWQSMALHHLHNPGPAPAQYFIVAFGPQA